jgi:hypothetical protein
VPPIGVLGAEGSLGRLVVDELGRGPHHAVPLGGHELAADASALRTALARHPLVISCLGDRGRCREVVDAALDTGTHLVDPVGDPGTLRWVTEQRDGPAREVGVTIVLAAGLAAVPGDPLAHLAAHAVTAAREVHVCYGFPSSGGLLGGATAGTRRAFADLLGVPALALSDGRLVEELPGEIRRLAWFPRPVGPAHAAGIPAPEPLTVPRHVPSARTVRTYVSVTSWRAELLQASASLARHPRGRRVLERRLTAPRRTPSPSRRAATRWACVAEAAGEEGVARAWAYGTDPYATSAASLVTLARSVLDGHADAGVVPPSLVEVPADLLDALSARTDLRWSISRPSG